jgi:Zn-dependent peptidase ImmA (M78 family)
MAGKPSPVSPAVLRWAVEQDGRTLDALAEAADVPVVALEAWVAGETQPTVGQVSTLAKVLDRPRALFFLPRPPEGAGLPATFRHPPGADRDVTAAVRRKVRQTRRLQQALAWAQREAPEVEVPVARLSDSTITAAENARRWLCVPVSTQIGWRDDRAALAAWRQALDALGVFVFVVDLGRDDVRGFASWDDHAPTIVLNLTGVSPAARIFTMFHELGHLVLRLDSACVEPRDGLLVGAEVERWCENFAAEALMPRSDLQSWLGPREPGSATIETVKSIMTRYRVSGRAAAVRLVEMGLARPDLYAAVARAFVPKPPDPNSKPQSPPRQVARLRSYGPRAVSTILEALPERDALSILRLQVGDVRQLPETVYAGGI